MLPLLLRLNIIFLNFTFYEVWNIKWVFLIVLHNWFFYVDFSYNLIIFFVFIDNIIFVQNILQLNYQNYIKNIPLTILIIIFIRFPIISKPIIPIFQLIILIFDLILVDRPTVLILFIHLIIYSIIRFMNFLTYFHFFKH